MNIFPASVSHTRLKALPLYALQIPDGFWKHWRRVYSANALPYCAWNNRGADNMRVWIPVKQKIQNSGNSGFFVFYIFFPNAISEVPNGKFITPNSPFSTCPTPRKIELSAGATGSMST